MTTKIDKTLVQQLIHEQFPTWRNLSITAVKTSGWDNRTFHLGNKLLVRFPSAKEYASQVEKEQYWLPKLAPLLPLQIPTPIAKGKPTPLYPYAWSIYQWIEGSTASTVSNLNRDLFAVDLANFLITLQHIDTNNAPVSGKQNFYRGSPLSIYDNETKQALQLLHGKINTALALDIWNTAKATNWQQPAVWLHGDINPDNLLIKNGRLSAVIDFGQLGVGDPACDLAIAWTFFRGESRNTFRQTQNIDNDTWLRGTAWALWKALIIVSGLAGSNENVVKQSVYVLDEILTGNVNDD